jgi:hypothetical protein
MINEQPDHPRVRMVTRAQVRPRGVVELLLECGHSTRRRPHICLPQRVICGECT